MQVSAPPARIAEPPPRQDDVRGYRPRRFMMRIAPRRFDRGPAPEGTIEVPRGNEPASPGRPVLAALAIVAFAAGLWVQVDRWNGCRSAGGHAIACLIDP